MPPDPLREPESEGADPDAARVAEAWSKLAMDIELYSPYRGRFEQAREEYLNQGEDSPMDSREQVLEDAQNVQKYLLKWAETFDARAKQALAGGDWRSMGWNADEALKFEHVAHFIGGNAGEPVDGYHFTLEVPDAR